VAPADPPWLGAVQDAHQRLADYAAEYAGLAAAALAPWQSDGAPLVERYQRLFMPPGLVPARPESTRSDAAWLRMQQAGERYARLALAIATDAGRRLVAALSASGPAAPPVTSLRELHALWIECGEAAWAAAAHGDEFAAAQAELLAAHVELAAAAAPR
jgi:poly(hydroxyalkanoate) synthase III subunit E